MNTNDHATPTGHIHSPSAAHVAKTPGCVRNPSQLLAEAEMALSDTMLDAHIEKLSDVWPKNPHEQGRNNERLALRRSHTDHAKHLIWA